MTKVVVCICSPTVGSLANALTYLADSQEILNVTLILLSDNYATAPGVSYIEKTEFFLDQLSAGNYNGKDVEVDFDGRQCYRRAASKLRDAKKDAKPVYIRDLATLLRSIVKSTDSERVIVDVTCLPKPLAADVTITCTFLGFRVYSFELIKPVDRDHPENSMYHALPEGGFRYPCLTDPAVIEESMRELISKKTLRISVLVVCIISIGCFSLLMWFKPRSSVTVDLTLWIGLVASALGIGTGLLQLIEVKGSH